VKAPNIVIVTPALAAANNGNWQTAQRWARLLAADYRVRLTDAWQAGDEAVMIALHARRSAASVQAWRQRWPDRPLVLVLTGTDLYHDITVDGQAQRSLQLADRLVVLNELGPDSLAPALRAKTQVCLQSSPTRQTLHKTSRHLRALMVGHLRSEKSPQTYFDAARRLGRRADILFDHVGSALDPSLADQARALAADDPQYRWLGALPHAVVRARIQAAHVLVHSSRIEGGAHVVIEALTAGTPVIASRIAGNVGLLGADYAGYFDWGDDRALVALLEQARDDGAMLPRLRAQCAARAPLFAPAQERQTLLNLLSPLAARPTAALEAPLPYRARP
jgi:putative glycosyltransferase (TIGR04348 family)